MIAEILSSDFFSELNNLVLWLLVCVSIPLLVYGANWLVSGAVALAARLGLSTVVIGATIVSLGTTAPEMTVSVMASINGQPEIALGNSVGSIICDTALIFGLGLVLTRLPVDRFVLRRQGVLKLATCGGLVLTAGLLAWAHGGITGVVMPRWIGFLYLAALVGYMILSVRWTRQHPQAIPDEARQSQAKAPGQLRQLLLCWGMLLAGLAGVIAGSRLMIGSVEQICIRTSVPQSVMAVTLVALGTSLPELVTAIASVIKGHGELLIGNVIGADILNVLSVTGAAAAVRPLSIDPTFYRFYLPVMAVAVGIMAIYIFSARSNRFHRWQGVPLLAVYLIFLLLLVRLM